MEKISGKVKIQQCRLIKFIQNKREIFERNNEYKFSRIKKFPIQRVHFVPKWRDGGKPQILLIQRGNSNLMVEKPNYYMRIPVTSLSRQHIV